MKCKFISINFLVFTIFFCSCKNENQQDKKNGELLKKERGLQDSILNRISSMSGKQFELFPKDTIIELSNYMDLIIWKNSFATNSGEPYFGKVIIDFNFTNDPLYILFSENSPDVPDSIVELKGVLNLSIKDERGNDLSFNPNYATGLRFLPETKMLGGLAYRYDTVVKSYYSPIKIYELYKNKEVGMESFETDLNFQTNSNGDKKNLHDNKALPKGELIGYELTLKYPGFYYIGRRAKEENLHDVSINIHLKSTETLKWGKAKVFLFSQDEDYNYYLRTRYTGSGYKIIPAPGYSAVKLPLNYKYTALAYHIEGEKCYIAIKENIILSSTSEIELTLKEETVGKIIKTIENLQ